VSGSDDPDPSQPSSSVPSIGESKIKMSNGEIFFLHSILENGVSSEQSEKQCVHGTNRRDQEKG
jgi:hypothetical protein